MTVAIGRSLPARNSKECGCELGDLSRWRVSPASAPQIIVLEAFARVGEDAYVIIGGRGFGRLLFFFLNDKRKCLRRIHLPTSS